jgi:hypothetical protein
MEFMLFIKVRRSFESGDHKNDVMAPGHSICDEGCKDRESRTSIEVLRERTARKRESGLKTITVMSDDSHSRESRNRKSVMNCHPEKINGDFHIESVAIL